MLCIFSTSCSPLARLVNTFSCCVEPQSTYTPTNTFYPWHHSGEKRHQILTILETFTWRGRGEAAWRHDTDQRKLPNAFDTLPAHALILPPASFLHCVYSILFFVYITCLQYLLKELINYNILLAIVPIYSRWYILTLVNYMVTTITWQLCNYKTIKYKPEL